MSASSILKTITAGCELLLGIPFLGGLFIIAHAWSPLAFMFVFHLVTLIVSLRQGQSSAGSILGMITSLIGWIPVVGMLMHIITGITLVIGANFSRSYKM